MIKIAGLVPFTTIDYPDHLAAVLFLKGCPLRCPFCHNYSLQDPSGESEMDWETALAFFKERSKRLDGIVFSGGEPLMQPAVEKAIEAVHQLGLSVGIHTSGVYPERLENCLPFLDWIGLDIKAPWSKYQVLTGQRDMAPLVRKSLSLLISAEKNFECRTTCDPRYLTKEDILEIATDLSQRGVKTYMLQKYRTFEGDQNPPSVTEIESFFTDASFLKTLQKQFEHCSVRG